MGGLIESVNIFHSLLKIFLPNQESFPLTAEKEP